MLFLIRRIFSFRQTLNYSLLMIKSTSLYVFYYPIFVVAEKSFKIACNI